MTKIAIITDSTCNIPPEMIDQYHIYVVPQHLIWGTEDLLDERDITPDQFYERLVKDPVHPKTAQPPAPDFAREIERACQDGAAQVFLATLSAELSGTFASAKQAAEESQIEVRVHDSKSVAMGLGWQVVAAARARDKGGGLDEMEAVAEAARKHTCMMLTLDTLDFLYKGGRIGGARRLVGTALNIKPRLVVDSETGLVTAGESSRTRSKAIEATYQAFFARMKPGRPLHVAVHHARAEQACQALAERVRTEYPTAEVIMNGITPVLGTHGGPGALALAGYYED